MVYVKFFGCGGSERVVQRRNSPYLEIHSSESALDKSKNSLALDDLRFSKKLHYLPDGTESPLSLIQISPGMYQKTARRPETQVS